MNQVIKEKLSLLKELPGCYLMKDKDNKVIYVGKAKKLVNRVSSYFNQEHTGKTKKLVSEICDFDTIIVNSDKEAFLLEINLIHQYNPPFNILLKDSKVYPYIELNMGDNPCLRIARNVKNKHSKYFGPYSDSSSAYETINLLNRLYPLRKCENIPTKPCLYYHIGQCLGPCINKINKEEYDKYTSEISSFLNGNTSHLLKEYKDKMKQASDELKFEDANEYKKIVDAITHISSRQSIQLDPSNSFDCFGFHIKDDYISISCLMYRAGVLKVKTNNIVQVVGEPKEFLTNYIIQYYLNNIVPKEIIISDIESKDILEEILNTKIIIPIKGIKYDILTKAAINAKEQMQEKYMLSKKKEEENEQIINDLKTIVGLDSIHNIEMIDNAHFNGANPVSGVIVYTDLKPNRKLYRKYKIDTDNTKDDLKSMENTLYRRYYRKIVENDQLSDLLIVDGGLNQVHSAKSIIDSLGINIKVVGLAKDDNHNTDSLILDSGERIYIKDNKNLFFFLANMQDEVHRYTISFHKDSRSKSMTHSKLDDVKGLGIRRKSKLLEIFNDIETISKLSVDELSIYVPKNVAISILEILNK